VQFFAANNTIPENREVVNHFFADVDFFRKETQAAQKTLCALWLKKRQKSEKSSALHLRGTGV